MNRMFTLIYHANLFDTKTELSFDLRQFVDEEETLRKVFRPIKEMSVKAPEIKVLKDLYKSIS